MRDLPVRWRWELAGIAAALLIAFGFIFLVAAMTGGGTQ